MWTTTPSNQLLVWWRSCYWENLAMTLEQYAARRKWNEIYVTAGICALLTIMPLTFFIALLQHGAAIAGK
jgi:hypothetical protein